MAVQLENGAKSLSKKDKICWGLIILVPLIVLCLPNNEIFTNQVQVFLAVTLCGILFFAFEVVPFFIPAMLLPVAYILSEVAPAEVAFAPWYSTMPWMMLSALLIVNIVDRIGLLQRGAYFIILKTGGTYRGILYGLMFVGLVFNLFLPGIIYITLIPLAYGICTALNLGRSKAAVGIMFASILAANMPSFIVYNPGFLGLALGIVGPTLGVEVGWLQCLWQNIIFIPMCFLMVFILEKMYKPDVEFKGKEFFQQQFDSFGKITKQEKKALFLLSVFVIALMTSGIHGINIGWIFVGVACLFYFPGFNIGIDQDIMKVNFSLVLFIASCMSIGQVSGLVGMGDIIAKITLPVLENSNAFVFILIIWVLAVVLNLLLTPLAAIATFTLPMTQIAMELGIDPLPVIYTFIQGLDQVIMPYEFANYLFLFSFGVMSMKQFMQFFGIKMLINIIFIMVCAIPFWYLIGIL